MKYMTRARTMAMNHIIAAGRDYTDMIELCARQFSDSGAITKRLRDIERRTRNDIRDLRRLNGEPLL